jgi:predicted acyltransferase
MWTLGRCGKVLIMTATLKNPTANEVQSAKPSTERLISLDQFRGYTVVGMLLVNYFGGYKACAQVLKHTHDYCSYADTIMPQFLFAVGFALRLTFGRRMQTQGSSAAYARMIRRLLGLVLVSIVVYNVSPRATSWDQLREMSFWQVIGEPLKRQWFQTLMHIAVTSLWLLPVVHRPAKVRIVWMLGSAIAHVLLSYWFNFTWANTAPNAIDGGPLGFLTWCIPAIVGTLACDYFVQPRDLQKSKSYNIAPVIGAAFGLMLFGYVMSCPTRLYDVPESQQAELVKVKLADDPVFPTFERIQSKLSSTAFTGLFAEPPFVKPPDETIRKWNYWMMSQRAGTLTYLTFSAGFSLLVFVLFYVVCDVYKLQLPLFRTFGTNALVAYILHSMVSQAVQPFFPKDSPWWFAYTGLGVFFLITWLFVKQLEKQGAYLRV